MAKFFIKKPKTEVRILDVDNAGTEYQVWLIRPVLLGSAKVLGPMRLEYEGRVYSNMSGPAQEMLNAANEPELAKAYETWTKKPPEGMLISGLQFANQDRWGSFCKLRGIEPTPANLAKTYVTTPAELRQLGIEVP